MTARQTERVIQIIEAFVKRALTAPDFPQALILILRTVKTAVENNQILEKSELEALAFVLDLYFSAFDEDDVDPLAEQAFAKLTGYFPDFDEPWYDRITKLKPLVFPDKKIHKSERWEELGY